MLQASLNTIFGPLCVTETDGVITCLVWDAVSTPDTSSLLTNALEQLSAYCDGDLTEFDLPVRVQGPSLVQAVCDVMRTIPHGETMTYGDIAKRVGASAQAVGQACGRNPIPVIIPCHRVMGAGGKLVGFSGAGGVETKVALLRHENAAGLLI